MKILKRLILGSLILTSAVLGLTACTHAGYSDGDYDRIIKNDADFVSAIQAMTESGYQPETWFIKNKQTPYYIQLVLNKDVTIIGESTQGVKIGGNANYADMPSKTAGRIDTNGNPMTGEQFCGIIEISDCDVTLKNLTVIGDEEWVSDYFNGITKFCGIGFINSNVTLTNVNVDDIRMNDTFFGVQDGVSLAILGSGTSLGYELVMNNCKITNFQKCGILLRAAVSKVQLTDCLIQGIGDTTLTAQNGIQLEAATADFIGNTFRGLRYTPEGTKAFGILVNIADYNDNYSFKDNTFDNVEAECNKW